MPEWMGVDWVPLHRIPTPRRLQTLAVLQWSLLFILGPVICYLLFLYILLFTQFTYVPLFYLAWILYDRNTSSTGGRRINWVRKLKIWEYYRDYFPITLIKTEDLDPNKNYIFGYHPHGILACGGFGNFATEATGFSKMFPGITPHLLTLKANFYHPLIRAYILYCGVCDVSKESINWILTKKGTGNAAVIVIGGADEALLAHQNSYDLTLKNRKGFVKMALRTGSSLVPVYSFGENDVFYQADNPKGSKLRQFQEMFKRLFGFSPPLFHGRGVFNYSFGFLPFRTPINTIVGKPIHTEKIAQPTSEDVDNYHKLYIEALSSLFDDNKTKYGVNEKTKLNFV
ncbi:unnamed protein product [Owenia fusiformis]|uniref:Acyltransferase n=1 Tax=Owenia fusiformis TaxID=6347 RepID=A0A8J1XV69_OWEFU|nr:unnamed protein product [Owenia fusiformis]